MKLTELLNIKHPLIQGGMANVSGPELATAVSEAGGLGVLASGGYSVEEVKNGIDYIRAHTDKPFAVNVVLHHPDLDSLLQAVVDKKVAYVILGGGNPAPHFSKLDAAGIKVICVVGNVKMARKVEDLGAIACIFEGAEAGGHIGALNTMAELPSIADSVTIPVISAGGIYTGRQILAAQVLGAAGVQIGSRFLVAEETPVHEAYKKYLIQAIDSDSVVTGQASGHPVRVVKNKLTDKLLELEAANASPEEFEKYAKGSGPRAAREGDAHWGSIMAGQGLNYLTKIQPVAEIIDDLAKEYEEAKKNLDLHF